jgi:hypothetical protein
MSILSRLARLLSGTPPVEPTEADRGFALRHDRREAGRDRNHETGEPAWDAVDRLESPGAEAGNPDAASEILGD